MKRRVKLMAGILICLNGMGQTFHVQPSNSFFTAGAYSTHFLDAFSFRSNPACLGARKNFSCGALAERKWMLAELDNYELAATGILGKGGVAIMLQHSGDADLSEQGAELAYGMSLGRLELGIGFEYLQDKTAGYGAAGFISCGFGIRFQLSDKLITGWELGLPVSGKAGETNIERGPQFYRVGFGYECREDLFLALQIIKESGQQIFVTGSLEYRYVDQFFFSFGLGNHGGLPFFKTGWKKNQICIQIFTEYETVLGFSPGLMLLWESKNKKR